MSSNQKTTVVVVGMILTAVVIGMAINRPNAGSNQSNNSNNSQVLSQNSDPMHKPVAVDSAVFNNLQGKPAPDFSLEAYDGKEYKLSDLKGKNVLLFFNEGLMCYPACWNQIAAFGKDTELAKKAVIFNITADPKNNWKQAIDKMPELAGATVLFDSNRQISQKYGVLTLPSSMHKGQFPGHSYVVIDKEGIVKFVRDDVQMAVRNQELSTEIDKL